MDLLNLKANTIENINSLFELYFKKEKELNNNNQEFHNKIKSSYQKIDLIDSFHVQELNKDYVLIKIKYLGKINKIIDKLKDQEINLKMIAGQWQLNII